MAKKSRKARAAARAGRTPQRSENKQQQVQAIGQKQAQQPTRMANQKSIQQVTPPAVNVLQPGQYDYVKKDLVRIGAIATALILIIIALTFVPALKAW